LGFDPQNVMAVRTRLPVPNDPKTDIYGTAAQEAPSLREILRRGRTLPGVKEAAVGSIESVPLNHDPKPEPAGLEGRDIRGNQPPLVEASSVTPEYFHLLGIPLLRGRFFSDQDNENAPQVAVVNDAFARTWWPNDNPLGKRVKLNRIQLHSHFLDYGGGCHRGCAHRIARGSQVFRRSTAACIREMIMSWRSSCAGGWTRLEFQMRCAWQVQSINPELPVFGAATLCRRRLRVSRAEAILHGNGFVFALTALLLAGQVEDVNGGFAFGVDEGYLDVALVGAEGERNLAQQAGTSCATTCSSVEWVEDSESNSRRVATSTLRLAGWFKWRRASSSC
jgi:hypothetical protein